MYVSESAVCFLGKAAVKATYTWWIAPIWLDKFLILSPDSAEAKKIFVEWQRNDWNISWTFKSYEIWCRVGWWRGLMAPWSESKKSRKSWIPNMQAEIFSETWTTLYQSTQRLFRGNLNLHQLRCEKPKQCRIFISSTVGQVILCWCLPGLL